MVLRTKGNFQGASIVGEIYFFFLIVSEFLNNLYHQSLAVKAEWGGRMPFADKVYFKIMLRL